jgi:hypothetical protein
VGVEPAFARALVRQRHILDSPRLQRLKFLKLQPQLVVRLDRNRAAVGAQARVSGPSPNHGALSEDTSVVTDSNR